MAKHFKTDGQAPNSRQMPNAPQAPSSFRAASHQANPYQSARVTQGSNPYISSGAHASRAGNYVGKDARKAAKPKRSKVATVLLVLGCLLIAAAVGMFVYAQTQYAKQNAINEKLAQYVTVSDTEGASDVPVVDWESLKAINDDIVGWIYIPGTVINYPVYQGEDNDTYLHTNAEGEYTIGGQIFMDFENAKPGMVDRQTLLYGHHLYDGSMFTDVDKLCDQEAFDAVTTIYYLAETETYELEPLFIYKSEATNASARQITFASDDEFHTYLSGLLEKASAQSSSAGSVVNSINKVLTLCTCDYNNDFGTGNGRSLLICAIKSDVSAVTESTTE